MSDEARDPLTVSNGLAASVSGSPARSAGRGISFSRRRMVASGASLGGALLMAGAGGRNARGQSATPEAAHDEDADMGPGAITPAAAPGESTALIEPEDRRSVD